MQTSSVVLLLALTFVSGQVPIPSRPDGWGVGGPADAHAVIEMFLDPLCPDCKASWPTVLQVIQAYGTRIHFRIHTFPLPYHTNSFVVSQGLHVIANATSRNSDAIFKTATAIFQNQQTWYNDATKSMTMPEVVNSLATFVAQLGFITKDKFLAGMASDDLNDETRISWKYACSRGVVGTPTFLINGVATGADASWSLNDWKSVIDPILASNEKDSSAIKDCPPGQQTCEYMPHKTQCCLAGERCIPNVGCRCFNLKNGKEMVDFIADYLTDIRSRRVLPNVKPGYMRSMIDDEAPLCGEQWEDIFKDVERVIMPGITHWQSPYMHAYFPALNSYPSMLGDMLANGLNQLGFTWASSPACTELETIVMDWLAKMIGLPNDFLHSQENTTGGGVIQTTASEATLVALLAARKEVIHRVQAQFPYLSPAEINGRLVAYCSDQAHSSVEKACLIGLVKLNLVSSDESLRLRGNALRQAIAKDKENGLIPFYLCATLGTTGACAFDSLVELGAICEREQIWIHVDAAYAGSAFVCPEFRHFMNGVELTQSFAFNPSKWLMVHFDCTAMWVKSSPALHRAFNVDPLYLQHENAGVAIDYMHWQVPLSRRFRALKLWFVIRSFGIEGLQKHIRNGVEMAKLFESLVKSDNRFEIPAERHLGLVTFRLKGGNELTEQLLKDLNMDGRIHCVPASIKGKYIIRFTVTASSTNTDDIRRDWQIIRQSASKIHSPIDHLTPQGQLNKMKHLSDDFRMSLVLSNTPHSPCLINGSFAAILPLDTSRIYAMTHELSQRALNHSLLPISTRRRTKNVLSHPTMNKQMSIDPSMINYDYKKKRLVSPTSSSLPMSRQGSLDSRVEEILENNS
ncbi:unnamed protein product [Adineta ricciae]|uniref:Histidine decarboxylase n=1 Tax=Adineta ricciae TaxID=249248 RepID=A0A813TDC8_ADIRI|nr:unnamed protein product [Adineta ricciae]